MITKSKFILSALAVAVLAFASPVLAQYQPQGADGITASPKLRQVLDERHRNEAIPVQPTIAAMPCPKCVDKVTTRTDYTARGAYKPAVLVISHGCSGCDTTLVTTGVGKQAATSAVHKCDGCGAPNLACCNMAKGDNLATKGMEKPAEIAPLK